jgi:hypothetical protein
MVAPTAETIARARERYVAGDSVSRILADAQMSLGTLYLWLDGGPDDGSATRLPAIPRRRVVLAQRRKPLAGSPVSLVNRLWRTAERQVRDIEDRLRMNQMPMEERERDARMLAVIVKTVRELTAIRNADAERADDDAVDPDVHRQELARKLHGLIAKRGDGTNRVAE